MTVLASLAAAVVVGLGAAKAAGHAGGRDAGQGLLVAVFILATAHLLWTLWSSSLRRGLILRGLGMAVAASVACFALHAAFEHMLSGSLPAYAPTRSMAEHAVMVVVALLFLAVLVFQSQLPTWASRPGFARLYVHASNGFYLGTLFNKITRKIIA
jgi:NAD(P)H-quinone oxidoreductase subunit 5